MTGLRVLIAEDSAQDLALVRRALEATFGEVEAQVVDCEEAFVRQLEAGCFDAAIVDSGLPRLEVHRALELLKRGGLDLPTIVVSGPVGEDAAVATLRAGAHDCVLKSSLPRLGASVERELREAEARRQRKESERELRKAAVRFKSLVGSSTDFIFTLDREGRFTGAYGRWLQGEGLSTDVLLGQRPGDVFGEQLAQAHQPSHQAALSGSSVTYDWRWEGPQGTRHFQTSLSPLVEDGETVGVAGMCRELTELKKAQALLYASDRMLSIGTLAAGVAHDINNPLAAIIADLEFVARALAGASNEDPVEVAAALRNAREAAQGIRQVVSDLKLFSRTEERRVEPFDPHYALESALRLAWNELRHRARIVKHYCEVPAVEGNQAQLGQVFLNLLVNAAQALDDRGPAHNTITLRTYREGDGRAAVEVEDTGHGVPPENLSRIFDPFFTTRPVGVGMGLGLFVCRRILSAMGGELEVESEVGNGSVFTVLLRPSPGASQERKVEVTQSSPGRRGKVLVIDDERMIGAAVRRTLEAEHDVTVQTSAPVALALFNQGHRYDVIFCDLMMPTMNGMELHAELVNCCPEQAERMVFLTGGAFTSQAQEFLEKVSNLRLEKPFDSDELRLLVNARVK